MPLWYLLLPLAGSGNTGDCGRGDRSVSTQRERVVIFFVVTVAAMTVTVSLILLFLVRVGEFFTHCT